MRIRAQLMMVMALDKCLGCHACSVSCKRSWTSRSGSEQAWFNNVETRPGAGYPQGWEDRQDRSGGGEDGPQWGGGWELDGEGHLRLRGGGSPRRLPTLFGGRSPSGADDYYEPWTYDVAGLTDAPLSEGPPAATAHSLLTGKPMAPHQGPNWDDDLAGTTSAGVASPGVTAPPDPTLSGPEEEVRLRYEQIFMFYLPRICNHCLNPSCAAACPSKAIYKRSSDGIVLVDENKCRGRSLCVAACPYKKVYLNRVRGKAEKCMFCLPGVTEGGLPALCAETCVGRLRFIGVVLYDADAVAGVAELGPESGLVEAQRRLLLDPYDDSVLTNAEEAGIPHQWLEAARRSPVYALVKELRVALPLHPEFRTLPMVWYVPPLSPALDSLQARGGRAHGLNGWDGPSGPDGSDPGNIDGPGPVFSAARDLRIPVDYLAEVFAAGDRAPVEEAVNMLIVMREFKRHQQIHGGDGTYVARRAGIDPDRLERLFQLLGLAERKERFVIPTARYETARPQKPPSQARPPAAGRGGEDA